MGPLQDRLKANVNGVAAVADNRLVVRYLQCQRNHARRIGGHVVDGCGEFTASGPEGEAALTCVACQCHRDFHRRVWGADDGAFLAPSTPPAAGDRR